MKKIIPFLFILHSLTGRTQTGFSDSSRYIELKEVTVPVKNGSSRQQLVRFVRTGQAASLEDIMSRIPELNLLRRGSYGMEPSIRSLSSGQINVLIDGMRIHGACTDKMDPPTIYIEPVNLDRMEVQTGNHGFLHGSAIGGSINLAVASPSCHAVSKISGLFSSGYQSAAQAFYESLQLNYAGPRWSLLGSITGRKAQAYRSGGGDKVAFSQYEKINYSLSAIYQYNPQTRIKLDFIGDNGWNIGYPALPMDVGYAAAGIASVSLEKENPLKKITRWRIKAYANQVRHYMDDTHRPNVPMHMDMPGKSQTAGLYSDGEIRLNSRQQIRFTADLSLTYLKASMTMYQTGQLPMYMLTWPDNRKDQAGAGASWQWQADSNWSLRATARIDLVNYTLRSQEAKDHISILGFPDAARSGFLKNISFGATRRISPVLKTNASIGWAERMPTASEYYGFYLFNAQDGYDYIGNPDLRPEQSLLGELNMTVQGKKAEFKLGGFYQYIRRYIMGRINTSYSSMTIGANGVKTWEALPYAILTGIEASLVWKPVDEVSLISTLRYTYGKTNKGEALPMIAPLKNLSALRYQPGRVFLQAETEQASRQQRYSLIYGEDATAAYTLLHIRGGYSFSLWQKKTDLQAGIENILDKKYHEHTDWGNIPRPGRNFYMQLLMRF